MTRPGLVVAGLDRLSVTDWPGRRVATVLTQGCPWRCGYCHHPGLCAVAALGGPPPRDTVPWSEVVAFLAPRRRLLDGVVFSGGEPTLHPGLLGAIDDVRGLGLDVGLHTAGPWPARLARLLPFVDWVGLDIKHLPSRYPVVTGTIPSGRRAFEALAVILRSGVDHEVRTTVDPSVHSRTELLALGTHLRRLGVREWVLQEAVPDGASPAWARGLAGRRLTDVLDATDLAWARRRVAA
ncbi:MULTISPECIES: anaerobic ribonucleoside-triphosphate reductase activating protein [Cellulosimicrobium]|nr:anaerobic ribonucleoside-triphosphate reductase activating protein [Cellulosimicrobium sp. 72-3]